VRTEELGLFHVVTHLSKLRNIAFCVALVNIICREQIMQIFQVVQNLVSQFDKFVNKPFEHHELLIIIFANELPSVKRTV